MKSQSLFLSLPLGRVRRRRRRRRRRGRGRRRSRRSRQRLNPLSRLRRARQRERSSKCSLTGWSLSSLLSLSLSPLSLSPLSLSLSLVGKQQCYGGDRGICREEGKNVLDAPDKQTCKIKLSTFHLVFKGVKRKYLDEFLVRFFFLPFLHLFGLRV